MNAILVDRALEKVPNRHVLVNLISRRVRQLNFGVGAERQPLLIDNGSLSAADTALLELIEGRMTFEMPQFTPLKRPTQAGNRPKGWVRMHGTDGENHAYTPHSPVGLTPSSGATRREWGQLHSARICSAFLTSSPDPVKLNFILPA